MCEVPIEDPSLALGVEGRKCLVAVLKEEQKALHSHLPEMSHGCIVCAITCQK